MMTMGFAVVGCWRERRVGSCAVCSCAVARARGAGDARTRRARARAVKMRVGDTAAALVSDAVLVKGSTRDGFRSREATTRRRAPLYDTRRVLYIRALRRHKGGVYTNVFAVCARVIVFLVFLCARDRAERRIHGTRVGVGVLAANRVCSFTVFARPDRIAPVTNHNVYKV
mmetsp:Transcript_3911/g.14190  ORF Transcript_3911/g.14190 Transcript_3911/m.14190 type:complete len:171 (-) Transcript_3911:2748-3260(-)